VKKIEIELPLRFIYSLKIDHNKLYSLKDFEIMFPNLTVLDVSRNKLRTEYELEFLIYLETMAELRVSGNDMFIEGYRKAI